MRRHRRLPVSAAAALLTLAAASRSIEAQRAPAGTGVSPHGQIAAGIALATPLLVDGNGTRVSVSPAWMVAVHLMPFVTRIGPLRPLLVIRGSAGTVRLEDDGERWSAGSSWQVDAVAAGVWEGARIAVEGGGGASLLGASRHVAPIARPRLVATAEATVRVSVSPGPGARWAGTLTAQGNFLPSGGGRKAGGIGRLLLGVAHAF